MKRMVLGGALALGLLALCGCEFLRDEPEPDKLVFKNMSHYVVTVYPLTVHFTAFAFGPGETVTLKNIPDPDFRHEPLNLVQEGLESDERRVVFVDAPPEEEGGE